jgi:hypothetical protein
MTAGKMKSYSAVWKENQARHCRVTNYLQVLKDLAFTSDIEEQKLVKRRILQICLELQDMKDCMKEGARSLLSIQEIEQLDNRDYHDTDPSVRFFGLEWRSVFTICEDIYQEEHTMNHTILARVLSALNKLEYDVGNHAVALHEKRHSVEHVHVEEKHSKRRKSCHHYKAKHERLRSRQTSLSWMERASNDKGEDSGIEISSTESNDLEDMKSKEKEQTIVKNQNSKISHKKKGSRFSIIENITSMVKSRLKLD